MSSLRDADVSHIERRSSQPDVPASASAQGRGGASASASTSAAAAAAAAASAAATAAAASGSAGAAAARPPARRSDDSEVEALAAAVSTAVSSSEGGMVSSPTQRVGSASNVMGIATPAHGAMTEDLDRRDYEHDDDDDVEEDIAGDDDDDDNDEDASVRRHDTPPSTSQPPPVVFVQSGGLLSSISASGASAPQQQRQRPTSAAATGARGALAPAASLAFASAPVARGDVATSATVSNTEFTDDDDADGGNAATASNGGQKRAAAPAVRAPAQPLPQLVAPKVAAAPAKPAAAPAPAGAARAAATGAAAQNEAEGDEEEYDDEEDDEEDEEECDDEDDEEEYDEDEGDDDSLKLPAPKTGTSGAAAGAGAGAGAASGKTTAVAAASKTTGTVISVTEPTPRRTETPAARSASGGAPAAAAPAGVPGRPPVAPAPQGASARQAASAGAPSSGTASGLPSQPMSSSSSLARGAGQTSVAKAFGSASTVASSSTMASLAVSPLERVQRASSPSGPRSAASGLALPSAASPAGAGASNESTASAGYRTSGPVGSQEKATRLWRKLLMSMRYSAYDVVKSMGAAPIGVTNSLMRDRLDRGRHTLQAVLAPHLSSGGLGFRHLPMDHETGGLRDQPSRLFKLDLFTASDVVNVPEGVDVVERGAFVCLHDRVNILSNIATVSTGRLSDPGNVHEWEFVQASRASSVVVRTSSHELNLSLYVELFAVVAHPGHSDPRTGLPKQHCVSLGWGFVPIGRDERQTVLGTREVDLTGGTLEEPKHFDPRDMGGPVSRLLAAMGRRRHARVKVMLRAATGPSAPFSRKLPPNIVCLNKHLPLLATYQHVLAHRLVARTNPSVVPAMRDTFLHALPELLEHTELGNALGNAFADVMAAAPAGTQNNMDRLFELAKPLVDKLWPLLHLDTLKFAPRDLRMQVAARCLAQSAAENLLSDALVFEPLDAGETLYDPVR